MLQRPAFITFTGADDAALLPGVRELSARYPIEWGILIDPDREGAPLFPDRRTVERMRTAGVRLCAHLCGETARQIAAGLAPSLDLAGFSRVQVNHGREGADSSIVRAVSRFAATHGVRGVLQCADPFPVAETAVDWLYDVSFGTGRRPESYPALRTDSPFCGYSGGIGPDNVLEVLNHRLPVDPGYPFWIDMESGVRSDAQFDLHKCGEVCRAVYGPRRRSEPGQ